MFSPSTSVCPAKSVHSTNFSILTVSGGRYNRAVVAAVWSPPPNIQIKKNKNLSIQDGLGSNLEWDICYAHRDFSLFFSVIRGKFRDNTYHSLFIANIMRVIID
jgi:hypothetical protein